MKILRLFSRGRGATYLLFIVLILGPGPAQRRHYCRAQAVALWSWDVTNVANCE